MHGKLFCKKKKPLRRRFISCVGLCVFALVAVPLLHECICHAETANEHSAPVPEHSCSICDYVHLTAPCVMVVGILPEQTSIVRSTSFSDTVISSTILSATDVAGLARCRAPPVL